jgi:hypothetical protein
MKEATKLVESQYNNPVYDQVALMEQVGVVNSTRMMKILRNLRKNGGPLGEGKLASQCGERMFYPEWKFFMETLLKWGWVKTEATGRMIGDQIPQQVSLTPLGEEFMASRLDPKPKSADPQPTE